MNDPFSPRAVRAARRRLLADDTGAATAEYAIATMATVDRIEQFTRC